MTPTLFDNPEYFRSRATEARAKAAQMGDPKAQRMMCSIAATYDQIASRAERWRASVPQAADRSASEIQRAS
jgi:hypothetical protein